MSTFLFDRIIFGPVNSRRLGQSLGINLLPVEKKMCNFDCIYCECGLNEENKGMVPSRQEVKKNLEKVLREFSLTERKIDAITFAGNGEPTLHPEFEGVIEDTYKLRNTFFPRATLALLTNSTTVISSKLHKSLRKIDQNIFKIDSVLPETINILNQPLGNYDIHKVIDSIAKIENRIIQTMFITGAYKGQYIDNTTIQELEPWLEALVKIQPKLVMIYTIERDTPTDTLVKVPVSKLEEIAEKVKKRGLKVQISG
jgi:wyosine [tRNA(Phe)-imidazoG37] synthetase (radical SAM superfamily)